MAAILLVTLNGCGSPSPHWVAPGTSSQAFPANTPSQLPSPSPSAAAVTGPAASYIARLPRFDPAPTPQPITVPAGAQAGWYQRIPTTQPVAFLTIDDGYTKTPEAPQLFAAAHVPVTLFLTTTAIADNPGYFKPFQDAGADIQDHTVNHVGLQGRAYGYQRQEICGGADQLAQRFGKRPTLFRAPGGSHDATTLKAAHDCGMKAVFMWTETVNTGTVRYQTGHTIQPGDIILMHFRPAFADDFLAALNAIHDAGLTPAFLSDYLA